VAAASLQKLVAQDVNGADTVMMYRCRRMGCRSPPAGSLQLGEQTAKRSDPYAAS
jgi:hypothetical protein